jgi:hypothetical protein
VTGATGGDEGLTAYVEAIEATFRARRGKDHALSPRDFALARGWFQAGISLATVLVGVDLAFEADPDTSSLSYCRRRVEDIAPPSSRRAGAEGERVSILDLQETLAALKERLLELPRKAFALPLVKVGEVQDLVAVAAKPNWEYLRGKLKEIDAEVEASALDALSPEDAGEVRAEAARAAERQRGRVDAASLDQAVGRLVRQRARERLKIPRVGLV